MSTKTAKQKKYEDFLFAIYRTRSVAMYGSGDCITRKAGSHIINFRTQSIKKYDDLFKYTFTDPSPKYIEENNKMTKINRRYIFIDALSAIVKFFDLPDKYKVLLHTGIAGDELDEWGVKLYNCCMIVVSIYFDDDKEKFDAEQVAIQKENIKQILDPHDTLSEAKEQETELPKAQSWELLKRRFYSIKASGYANYPPNNLVVDENFIENKKNHVPLVDSNELTAFKVKINTNLNILKKLTAVDSNIISKEQKNVLCESLWEIYKGIPYLMHNTSIELKKELLSELNIVHDKFFTGKKGYEVLTDEYRYYTESTIKALIMLIESYDVYKYSL